MCIRISVDGETISFHPTHRSDLGHVGDSPLCSSHNSLTDSRATPIVAILCSRSGEGHGVDHGFPIALACRPEVHTRCMLTHIAFDCPALGDAIAIGDRYQRHEDRMQTVPYIDAGEFR